jgi:hypothetical protein
MKCEIVSSGISINQNPNKKEQKKASEENYLNRFLFVVDDHSDGIARVLRTKHLTFPLPSPLPPLINCALSSNPNSKLNNNSEFT